MGVVDSDLRISAVDFNSPCTKKNVQLGFRYKPSESYNLAGITLGDCLGHAGNLHLGSVPRDEVVHRLQEGLPQLESI